MSKSERKPATSGSKSTVNARTQQHINETNYINSVLSDNKTATKIDQKLRQKIEMVKTLANGWEDEDILRVLEENDFDAETVVNKIMDGTAGRSSSWEEVHTKRAPKAEGVKPKKEKTFISKEGSYGKPKANRPQDQNGEGKRTPRAVPKQPTGPKTFLKSGLEPQQPVQVEQQPTQQDATTTTTHTESGATADVNAVTTPAVATTPSAAPVVSEQQQQQQHVAAKPQVQGKQPVSAPTQKGKSAVQPEPKKSTTTTTTTPVVALPATSGWRNPPASVRGVQQQVPITTTTTSTAASNNKSNNTQQQQQHNTTSTSTTTQPTNIVSTSVPTPTTTSVNLPESSKWNNPLIQKAQPAAASTSTTSTKPTTQSTTTTQATQSTAPVATTAAAAASTTNANAPATQPSAQAAAKQPQQQPLAQQQGQQQGAGKTWKPKEGTSPSQSPKLEQQPATTVAPVAAQQAATATPTTQASATAATTSATSATTSKVSPKPRQPQYEASPVTLPASSQAALSGFSLDNIQFGMFGTGSSSSGAAPVVASNASATKDSYTDSLSNQLRHQQQQQQQPATSSVASAQQQPATTTSAQAATTGAQQPSSRPTHQQQQHYPQEQHHHLAHGHAHGLQQQQQQHHQQQHQQQQQHHGMHVDAYGQDASQGLSGMGMGMEGADGSMPATAQMPAAYSYMHPHGYMPAYHQAFPGHYDSADSAMRPMMMYGEPLGQQAYGQPSAHYPRDLSQESGKYGASQDQGSYSDKFSAAASQDSQNQQSGLGGGQTPQQPSQAQQQQQQHPYYPSQFYGFPYMSQYPSYSTGPQHFQYSMPRPYQRSAYPNYPASSTGGYPPSSYNPDDGLTQDYKGAYPGAHPSYVLGQPDFQGKPTTSGANQGQGATSGSGANQASGSASGASGSSGQQASGANQSTGGAQGKQSGSSYAPSAPPSGSSSGDLSGYARSSPQSDTYKSTYQPPHVRDSNAAAAASYYNVAATQPGYSQHQGQQSSGYPYVMHQHHQYGTAHSHNPRASNSSSHHYIPQ